jgi:hypothetical protein
MSQRIRVSGPTQPRIETHGKVQPHVDAAQVAAALGGERIEGQIDGNPSPVTLYALRSELLRRRQSSGGRPGIRDARQRVKIPLSDQDWMELEELAGELSAAGFSPSPGQIASVLLHAAIQSVRQREGEKPNQEKLVEAIARQLAASDLAEHRE